MRGRWTAFASVGLMNRDGELALTEPNHSGLKGLTQTMPRWGRERLVKCWLFSILFRGILSVPISAKARRPWDRSAQESSQKGKEDMDFIPFWMFFLYLCLSHPSTGSVCLTDKASLLPVPRSHPSHLRASILKAPGPVKMEIINISSQISILISVLYWMNGQLVVNKVGKSKGQHRAFPVT